MKQGNYIAKVVDCGIKPVSNGERAFMTFANEDGEQVEWSGSLSTEKSIEYCAKAAINSGFFGNDWNEFTMHKMDSSVTVEIKVVERERNGKTYMEVDGIFRPKVVTDGSAVKTSSAAKFAAIRAQGGPVRQPEKQTNRAGF